MKLELYQIDAFTDKFFGVNPACVVPSDNWLPNDILLKITRENAVAETAFFVDKDVTIHLRWFTPVIEMDLCGHATLATAHCLKTILNYKKDKIIFETLRRDLAVIIENDFYYLDFQSSMPIESSLIENISKSTANKKGWDGKTPISEELETLEAVAKQRNAEANGTEPIFVNYVPEKPDLNTHNDLV